MSLRKLTLRAQFVEILIIKNRSEGNNQELEKTENCLTLDDRVSIPRKKRRAILI